MENPRRPYARPLHNAPVRPSRAFFFEVNEDYCLPGLEPEIHFKSDLDRCSRKFLLQQAELLTYAAFDPLKSHDHRHKLSVIGIVYGPQLLEADVRKYFDDDEQIKVYPILMNAERSDRRIRDFSPKLSLILAAAQDRKFA